MLRLVGRWARLLLGLSLVLITGFIIANSFDERLSPRAAAMMAHPANHLAAKDNIFVALAGLDAPAGQSPVLTGTTRLFRLNERAQNWVRDPALSASSLTLKDPDALAFRGDGDRCLTADRSVWALAASDRAAIRIERDINQELFSRYLRLHSLSGYFETATPSATLFALNFPTAVRCTFLGWVAIRAQAGGAAATEALAELAADMSLWKRVLQGNGALVSKMMAAASLHADLVLLSDMITDPRIDAAMLQVASEWLRPVPIAAWRIGNLVDAEFRVAFWDLEALQNRSTQAGWRGFISQWGNRLVFKNRATQNSYADMLVGLRALADGDPANFSVNVSAWLEQWNLPALSYFYNPTGKLMVRAGMGGYTQYPARVYDVAAFQRLVCLVYEIRRQRISRERVPEFISGHPELATHPIDTTPFSWDPTTRMIAVKPVGDGPPGRRFKLRVGT